MEGQPQPRYWEKMLTTDRRLDRYLEFMNLSREDLQGKNILDAGAGVANFARDIQAEGLEANVTSLDPTYSLSLDQQLDNRGMYAGPLEATPDSTVAGLAEQAPFPDEIFDLIVANYSVPYHLPAKSPEQYRDHFLRVLEEFDRILKSGGEIRIYPLATKDEFTMGDEFDEEIAAEQAALTSFLNTHGYQAEQVRQPEPTEERSGEALLILRKLTSN